MISVLQKAASSLLLIVIVGVATRVGFACYQERQFSPKVLSIVPFQTEAGHIAYSIASGKGYSSPFQRDSGPTAWLAPVYPWILAGIFKLFGIYTLRSFVAALSLNILFSAVNLRADFLRRQPRCRSRRGKRRSVVLGSFSRCHHNSL